MYIPGVLLGVQEIYTLLHDIKFLNKPRSLLLEAAADPNTPQRRGRTALLCASYRGHVNAVQILAQGRAVELNQMERDTTQARADLNLADNLGMTALSWAAAAGCAGVVGCLLRAKADQGLASHIGLTPFLCACGNGHLNIIDLLLAEEEKSSSSVTADTTYAAIALASAHGYSEILQRLLGLCSQRGFGSRGFLPALNLAARGGNGNAVCLLLDAARDVPAVVDMSASALARAADRGCSGIVGMLLSEKKDKLAHDAYLEALICASSGYSCDTMLLLLKHLPEPCDVTAIACMCAARMGHENMVLSLLQEYQPWVYKFAGGIRREAQQITQLFKIE